MKLLDKLSFPDSQNTASKCPCRKRFSNWTQ